MCLFWCYFHMDKAIDSIVTISLAVQSFFVTDILKKKKNFRTSKHNDLKLRFIIGFQKHPINFQAKLSWIKSMTGRKIALRKLRAEAFGALRIHWPNFPLSFGTKCSVTSHGLHTYSLSPRLHLSDSVWDHALSLAQVGFVICLAQNRTQLVMFSSYCLSSIDLIDDEYGTFQPKVRGTVLRQLDLGCLKSKQSKPREKTSK